MFKMFAFMGAVWLKPILFLPALPLAEANGNEFAS
jgi:hypothetical protein